MTAHRQQWLLRCDTLGRPPCLNAERAGHWTAQARTTAAWREAYGWLARQQRVPPLAQAQVESWPTYPDRRSLPDLGGWLPATKAAIDGLVDVGVLPDDGPAYLTCLTFLPPVVDGARHPALVLRLTGTLAGA